MTKLPTQLPPRGGTETEFVECRTAVIRSLAAGRPLYRLQALQAGSSSSFTVSGPRRPGRHTRDGRHRRTVGPPRIVGQWACAAPCWKGPRVATRRAMRQERPVMPYGGTEQLSRRKRVSWPSDCPGRLLRSRVVLRVRDGGRSGLPIARVPSLLQAPAQEVAPLRVESSATCSHVDSLVVSSPSSHPRYLSLPCPHRVGCTRIREDRQRTVNSPFAGETEASGREGIRVSHRGTLLENR